MNTDTLTVAEATQVASPASHAGNRNLGTDLKSIIVIQGWDSTRHDTRKYCDVKLHSGAGIGMACTAQFILGQTNTRQCVPFLVNRANSI